MRTAEKRALWKRLKRVSCKICREPTSQTTIHQTIINLEDNLEEDKI
jgi:hypothetical protein